MFQLKYWFLLATIGLATSSARSQDEHGEAPEAPPWLQRAAIIGSNVWLFQFEGRQRPRNPGLVTTNVENGGLPPVTCYNLFGASEHVWGEALPLRWDMSSSFVFNTRAFWGPPPAVPVVLRYRLASLVARPDDGSGAGALVLEHWEDPSYGGGTPMSSALRGFHRGWKEGIRRVGEPARVIHYDLRAVDDSTIQWFMTVDGEFWRWTYDGCGGERNCDWKDPRLYAVRVTEPFLILSDGKSLITEREGNWCVVQNLDQDADCVSMFTRLAGEPLTVIEYKTKRAHYFLHGNSVRDGAGRELFAVRESVTRTEKVTQAAELLIKRRQP